MDPLRVLPANKKGYPMGTVEEPLQNPFFKEYTQRTYGILYGIRVRP
jgi:hypothetical protein